MTKSEIINAIINGFTALGTVAVAILAIWGDTVRTWLAGPKLLIVPHNFRGAVVPITNGPRGIFYHLAVVNKRSSITATNCRVLLKKIWRKAPNGIFQEVGLKVPLIFAWAPSEIMPPYISLRKEQVLDFGAVIEGQDYYRPLLLSYTNNFQGFVHAGEIVRYGIEIVSDNFASPRLQVFEVAWNGKWSDNLDVMAQNLQIQEVTNQVAAA